MGQQSGPCWNDRRTHNPLVTGSSPAGPTKLKTQARASLPITIDSRNSLENPGSQHRVSMSTEARPRTLSMSGGFRSNARISISGAAEKPSRGGHDSWREATVVDKGRNRKHKAGEEGGE